MVAGSAAATVAAAPAASAANACTATGPWSDSAPGFLPNFYGVAPFNVSIDLSGSTIDHVNHCDAYLDFGDGSTPAQPASNGAVQHTYTAPGNYEVTLTLHHPDGSSITYTADVFSEGAAGQAYVGRFSGQNRLDTAVQVSQKQWDAPAPGAFWGQAHAAVIATSMNYPDALAGGPLAVYKQGPLLLTNPGEALYAGADAEINRVVPKNSTVYILGGAAAVPYSVDAQLLHEGYQVKRFAGANRFDTALQIAKDPAGMNSPANVVVATGGGFADALAAGPLAAGPRATRKNPADAHGQPAAIILTNGNAFFDAASADYVRGKFQTASASSLCKAVSAVGGSATAAVAGVVGSGGCWDNALAGSDRYDTARLVLHEFANIYRVGVASGLTFPDALTGGVFEANLNQPLLLTDPNSLSDAPGRIFNGMHSQDGVADVDIFGGPKAVTDHVGGQIIDAVRNGSYTIP